jgi:hypothetical protein
MEAAAWPSGVAGDTTQQNINNIVYHGSTFDGFSTPLKAPRCPQVYWNILFWLCETFQSNFFAFNRRIAEDDWQEINTFFQPHG